MELLRLITVVIIRISTFAITVYWVSTDRTDTAIFVVSLAGQGVDVLQDQIMISQYYDGFNPADKWIEVTNISGTDLPADTYFLALYTRTYFRHFVFLKIVNKAGRVSSVDVS